jgi:hypothetical protein
MGWIRVQDRLPKENERVKFLHNGYEFIGVCIHKPYPYQGVFSSRIRTNWFFMGNQNSNSSVITVEVTGWMPLEDE